MAGVVLDKDQFTCSVCLDVLRDPVTIPCGHSYCSDCIRNYWDQADYIGVFMCPQCRQSFNPRPALARSTLLADVVDRFKRSGLQEVSGGQQPSPALAQGDDVECDVCIGRKNKAVNSCLVCLASYCELHVRPHHDSAVFMKHKLVSASKRLQESLCARHDKLLEVFCRTDKQCICSMCLTDEHKGHDTVLTEVEIQLQQRQLGEMKLNFQRSIQKLEKESQELRQTIFSLNRSARLAAETSDSVFADLISGMELKRFELRELIKAQQKLAVSQGQQLLESINKEVAEHKKRETELDRLVLSDDHLHFLQSCQTLNTVAPVSSILPAVAVDPGLTFDPATKAVCDFKAVLQEVCQGGFVSIYEKVREVAILAPPNTPVHTDVTTPMSVVQPPVQLEETGIPSTGLDQSPVSPLNPFLSPGPVVPTFVFSPLGAPTAAATISIEQDQFSCPVCLEVLLDPVTIPCGHSYCLGCIEDYWNRGKPQKSQYSCPQCRQEFNPKPLLNRNTVLAELVEKFVQGGVREQPARERQRRQRHGVVAVPKSGAVKENLCPRHEKPVKKYCRTDHQGLCLRCVKSHHADHDVVQLVDERVAEQKKLQEASLKSTQNIKDVEKELRYAVKYIKHATEAAEEESDRVFAKLLRAIDKHRCDVKEAIRGREQVALAQTEQLLEKLERETAEVRRNEAELEKLCRSNDHLHFLQKSRSLHFPSKRVQMPNTDMLPYLMYKSMRGGLSELKEGLDESLQREINRISDKVISLKETSAPNEKTKVTLDAHILYDAEPKTREEFLHYYQDLTLDPNTANPYLSLSESLRGATTRSEAKPYPEHPERFSSWAQVLCCAGVAGRCYWEAAWAGKGGASVGVCYRGMNRIGGGNDSKLGHNAKSWSLDCSESGCVFRHDKQSVRVANGCVNRIGVYLDLRAGVLSFYNVSGGMLLLHSVHAAFSQPVHPGFWVGLGSTLKLCSL
nr:E3 ubiquitin/ISG15 ligase TRIM25-like [Nerophis lumbriciformis]